MNVLPIGTPSDVTTAAEPPPPTDAWTGRWPQSPAEFEALVDAWMDRLVHYAFRRLSNPQDAEDVVQDAFVRAYADRERLRHVERPVAYLYRMVANACADHRQRAARFVPLDDVGGENFASSARGPAEEAVAAEEAQRAEALLRQLPDAQAEAIRLRVYEDLRLAEIAELVGCSIDTVSSRLRYGFQKLRRLVSKKGGWRT